MCLFAIRDDGIGLTYYAGGEKTLLRGRREIFEGLGQIPDEKNIPRNRTNTTKRKIIVD